MMFNINKMRVIAASLAIASIFNSSVVYAGGIKDVLDDMFQGMMASSTPSSTQKVMGRTAFAGGSYQVRAKIVRPKFIDVSPPNIKAGCGGISAYGGAFSFISAAQFKQLLNAIAQNATGYAFQLALNTLCPSCNNIMARLADKISSLGQAMGDSCKIATTLVDAIPSPPYAASIKAEMEQTSQKVAAWGGYNDFYEAYKDPLGALNKASFSDKQDLTGNVVYRALDRANVKDWFASKVGSDDDLYEFMIGIIGTEIKKISQPTDNAQANDGAGAAMQTVKPEAPAPVVFAPRIEHLEELVSGSNTGSSKVLTVLKCTSNPTTGEKCEMSDSSTKNLSYLGTRIMVNQYLFGANDAANASTSTGIVARYTTNKWTLMSTDENKFFWSLQPEERTAIQSKKGDFELTKSYAMEIAERVAWREALKLYVAVAKAAKTAMQKTSKDENLLKRVTQSLEKHEEQMRAEYSLHAMAGAKLSFSHLDAKAKQAFLHR